MFKKSYFNNKFFVVLSVDILEPRVSSGKLLDGSAPMSSFVRPVSEKSVQFSLTSRSLWKGFLV